MLPVMTWSGFIRDTWCSELGYGKDTESDTVLSFALRKSRDGDTDGSLHNTDSNGNLNVFNVEHDENELWLNTNYFNPQNTWNLDYQFVFVLPRNYLRCSPSSTESFRKCLSHPPSCRPISLSWLDKRMYCPFLRAWISQAKRNRNLTESNFCEHSSIDSSF